MSHAKRIVVAVVVAATPDGAVTSRRSGGDVRISLEGAERDEARDVSTRPTRVRSASPEVDLSTFKGTLLKDVSASAI